MLMSDDLRLLRRGIEPRTYGQTRTVQYVLNIEEIFQAISINVLTVRTYLVL